MSPGKPEFVGGGGPVRFGGLPKVSGKRKVLLAVALVLLIPLGFFYFSCLEYIEPNEVGIKEIQIGMNPGIQEKVYGPGYVFVMPFGVHRIHHFPATVQVLELTSNPENAAQGSDAVNLAESAKIQTSDGFSVDVDVSILYHIADAYQVVQQLGTGDNYLRRGLEPKAEPVLKQTLGELTPEDFYNSELRVARANAARDLLDKELSPKGLKVEHVLVRYFRYTDEYQKSIEKKKLEDQMVFTNQSLRTAAMEQKNLNEVMAEGEMNVKVVEEEGKAYRVEKEAERDLYVRKKKAQGDLLVALAEAEAARLRNEAMQVLGADRKVAMKMADVLKGLDTIILPSGGADSLNPLDLGRMITSFGAGEMADGAASEELAEAAPAMEVATPEDLAARAAAAVGMAEEAPAEPAPVAEVTEFPPSEPLETPPGGVAPVVTEEVAE